MAETIELTDPHKIEKNKENPRLIFRVDELRELEQSIRDQGILVPLTVFRSGRRFVLLDGERRWRCAIRLGLPKVPIIAQPRPDRLQNIMMMFAIHKHRRDWDPLPTAYKLRDLEEEFRSRKGRIPNETELARLASISRGEVRRLKNLLGLPAKYHDELLRELEKPRSEQVLTVDHVLETTRAAAALKRRGVVNGREEDRLRTAIIRKFKSRVIDNTVAPRRLARIGRAIDREEISVPSARRIVMRLIEDPKYTIDTAFKESVEQVDFEHSLEQLLERVIRDLGEHRRRRYRAKESLIQSLDRLRSLLSRFPRPRQ